MSKKKQRHFIFTHNNYTDQDVEKYKTLDTSYIIFGFEKAPTTGTPHLQGYFHTTNPRTLSGVRKEFPGAHITIPDGPPDAQRKYCSKDGEFYESGKLPMSDIEKGEAGKQVWDDAFALASTGRLREIPNSILVPHYRTLKQIESDFYKPSFTVEIEKFHPWQQSLLDIIAKKPHPRQIHWRWSDEGGVGKSTFAKFLVINHDAIILDNAKSGDIAHALPREPRLIVFDYSRTQDGYINYGVIEQLKNGTIFCSKYESRPKYFPIPHIIIFANFEPNRAAFSQDRYDVVKLD